MRGRTDGKSGGELSARHPVIRHYVVAGSKSLCGRRFVVFAAAG
jgi:hypothetical protein